MFNTKNLGKKLETIEKRSARNSHHSESIDRSFLSRYPLKIAIELLTNMLLAL
jgi:hypothetical protein